MTKTKLPLSPAEFDAIYGKVPRLTVEVIVHTPDGVVLTKRSIEPCKGQWHIPGGTVYFGESLHKAVQRVARDELGVIVTIEKLLGYMEYPVLKESGYKGWPVGITFETRISGGTLTGSNQGEEVGVFKRLPPNMVADQQAFLEQYLDTVYQE